MQTLEQEVNKPTHYNSHESGVEPINICRYLPNDLGNVWKYNTRYEDKGTAKKDLKKLVYYFNDYRAHFIDDNNEVSEPFTLPGHVYGLMEQVIAAEPVPQVKDIFKQVYSIALNQGVLNPADLNQAIGEIDKYAESFC